MDTDPTRACTRCGSQGPFYTAPRRSWCIACVRVTSHTYYHAHRAQYQRQAQAKALAALLRIPEANRTRRQMYALLRSQLARGLKLCTYCCTGKRPGQFQRTTRTVSGRDDYCKACRTLLQRLAAAKKREERRPCRISHPRHTDCPHGRL